MKGAGVTHEDQEVGEAGIEGWYRQSCRVAWIAL